MLYAAKRLDIWTVVSILELWRKFFFIKYRSFRGKFLFYTELITDAKIMTIHPVQLY